MDQKTVLNWFGMEDPTNQKIYPAFDSGAERNFLNLEPSPQVSSETFQILIKGLWEKIQDGLTFADIENLLFFVLFLRFLILAMRYNLKTSFYITIIGFFAGYLWYRHLIDLISIYRNVLFKLPFFHRLGAEVVQLRDGNRDTMLKEVKLEEKIHWYQPGQLLYYAFTKGIVNFDPATGLHHYIDPISMLISNLPEPLKSKMVAVHYEVYQTILPKIVEVVTKFWKQLSGVAIYAVITRLGKRYCPYVIRWHWTFLLVLSFLEQMVTVFIKRVHYFETFGLIPRLTSATPSLMLQIILADGIITCVVFLHVGFTIFALFHALCGQYFYFPFIVENTEIHVGFRPSHSIYSGGSTAWQDPKEKENNRSRRFTRFWYGWFGRGTLNEGSSKSRFEQLIKQIWKRFKKAFRR